MSKKEKPQLDPEASAILEMLTGGGLDLEALLALEQQKEFQPVLDAVARLESKIDKVIELLQKGK